MAISFTKASKKKARLRLALIGPPGSGKTFTALKVATEMGGRIAVIDTERGSASKYAHLFTFDTHEPEDFGPLRYVEYIEAAEKAGYDHIIVDSLSHAWTGKGGALELVDNAAKRMKSSNSFMAWRDVTPQHNALVDAMLRCRAHLIVTVRVKVEWVVEDVNGKKVPRKVGLAPVQREGLEYEFDVVGDMDDSTMTVTKTRCETLNKAVVPEPGQKLAATLKAWLMDGVEPPPPVAPPPAPVASPSPPQNTQKPAPVPPPAPAPAAPSNDPGAALRSRRAKLWASVRGNGWDVAKFQLFCSHVLGGAKEAKDFTSEDMHKLESAWVLEVQAPMFAPNMPKQEEPPPDMTPPPDLEPGQVAP